MKAVIAAGLTSTAMGLGLVQALAFIDRYGRGVRSDRGPATWVRSSQDLLSALGFSELADQHLLIEYRWLLWFSMAILLGLALALACKQPRARKSWVLHAGAVALVAALGIFHLYDQPTHARIPTLFEPRFVSASRADFLKADDPVIAITHEGVSKAYPLWMVMRHHVINDRLAGDPVVATY